MTYYKGNDHLPSLPERLRAFVLLKTAAKTKEEINKRHPLEEALGKMDQPKAPVGSRVEAATQQDGSKAKDMLHSYLRSYGMEGDPYGGRVDRSPPEDHNEYLRSHLMGSILRFQQATGQDISGEVASAIDNTRKKEAYATADVLGLSRSVLEKKAALLGVDVMDAVTLELEAHRIIKKASSRQRLTPQETGYLEKMAAIQSAATGVIPNDFPADYLPESVLYALQKQSSMAEILLKKEQEKEKSLEPSPFAVDRKTRLEDEAERPHRKERREQIVSIFGGTE